MSTQKNSTALQPDFSRSLAFTLAAAIMLIPANLLPILTSDTGGVSRIDTIYSGILGLFESGLWPLALIVAAASLLIPFIKLGGLVVLMLAARRGPSPHARRLTRLYAVLDFIGRWSMLDVFLVAFLTSAVRFGALSTIRPGAGIVAFAAAVVLTILATHAFDPRTLWLQPHRSSTTPSQ
ncbi:paraquat-inducible membrane protein A [Nibricoccus aquaticus]|uniref:Paraquat-inducible membrane protein A n=1 Tax=Nibricoccus aquaticus TaxID=2576891 RepID=A0A290QM72_9BACT|nr:paraquat-inducible protein A [Nibricoccus aquaticus]ATC65671.1 paraquat-inducible membrane protein A [Nibricoccus aquaticus]